VGWQLNVTPAKAWRLGWEDRKENLPARPEFLPQTTSSRITCRSGFSRDAF
jgi:hypothetical protein